MEKDVLILSREIRKARKGSASPAINGKTQAVLTPIKPIVAYNLNGFGYTTGKMRI